MNKFEKSLRFISQAIQPGSPFYGQIYLVGGCVRDELLGERYSDLDLLVNMPNGQRLFVEHLCAEFPDICRGPFYYQRYGTTAMDVIIDGSMTLVECVEPHLEEYAEDGQTLLETRFCSLEEDAQRRDYTCNALYKNLHTGQILDPTGTGIEDLKNGLLRTPSDPYTIFKQDPVRMLRGIRFKHQKGFHLDPKTWEAIVACADTMAIAAPKRLRDELNKMLKSRSFADGIDDLLKCGLLKYVMPGLMDFFVDSLASESTPAGTFMPTQLWKHTHGALSVLTREHPHSDSIYKLATLVLDIGVKHGKQAAGQILVNSGIGKEKVASILHIIELYMRLQKMFRGGEYQARPRDLPHFITGLNRQRDDFRRMVRALNQGLTDEEQLPWRIFYDNAELPRKKGDTAPTGTLPPRRASRNGRGNSSRHRGRRNSRPAEAGAIPAPAAPSAQQASLSKEQLESHHKRNIKRREQRKRARQRKGGGNSNSEQAS